MSKVFEQKPGDILVCWTEEDGTMFAMESTINDRELLFKKALKQLEV